MRPPDEILGGSSQQDAQDFFIIVTEQISDETNRHRDRKDEAITVKDNDPRSLLHNALKYWKKYSTMHDSLISKYFQGLTVKAACCPNCRNRTINFEEFKMLELYMPNGSEASNIESLINISQSDTPHGWKCEACGTCPSHYQRRTSIARFPDRLAFCFQRSLGVDTDKDLRRITFPFQNLDLSNYFIQPEHRAIDTSDPDLPDAETLAQDHHFQSPFVYDCYAVVCHIGKTIKLGHYVAYTRNDSSHDPTDWLKYDDAEVTKGKVTGFGGRGDWANEMYGKKDQTAYLVFYERQGT
jgi:ubiquitin carboxyl-terminal hydrolase 8